ncbi:MAG TPA: hypothetical protein VK590_15755 [Saprospiraceae bacterium]|nr:hypothetical protein [Saprospiraceae bacterium]
MLIQPFIITTNHIMLITNKKYKPSLRLKKRLLKKCGKTEDMFLLSDEFCLHTGIKIEYVMKKLYPDWVDD